MTGGSPISGNPHLSMCRDATKTRNDMKADEAGSQPTCFRLLQHTLPQAMLKIAYPLGRQLTERPTRLQP